MARKFPTDIAMGRFIANILELLLVDFPAMLDDRFFACARAVLRKLELMNAGFVDNAGRGFQVPEIGSF